MEVVGRIRKVRPRWSTDVPTQLGQEVDSDGEGHYQIFDTGFGRYPRGGGSFCSFLGSRREGIDTLEVEPLCAKGPVIDRKDCDESRFKVP